MSTTANSLLLVALTTATTLSIVYSLLLLRFIERHSTRTRDTLNAFEWRTRRGQEEILRRMGNLEEVVERGKRESNEEKNEKENQARWSDPANNYGWGPVDANGWPVDANAGEEEEEEEVEEEKTEEEVRKETAHIGRVIMEAALDIYWRRKFLPEY